MHFGRRLAMQNKVVAETHIFIHQNEHHELIPQRKIEGRRQSRVRGLYAAQRENEHIIADYKARDYQALPTKD